MRKRDSKKRAYIFILMLLFLMVSIGFSALSTSVESIGTFDIKGSK